MEKIFSILKELSQNNNREWFTAHKKEFKEAQVEFEQFVSRLISAIAEFEKA